MIELSDGLEFSFVPKDKAIHEKFLKSINEFCLSIQKKKSEREDDKQIMVYHYDSPNSFVISPKSGSLNYDFGDFSQFKGNPCKISFASEKLFLLENHDSLEINYNGISFYFLTTPLKDFDNSFERF